MQINCEIENKKSRFLGFVFKVESVSQIKNYLEQLKIEHKKATHICYAYILSSPNLEKCFDDKEPSGTAGKPILNVLHKQNKSNIVAFVVRYFGGVKLGAGNLTRMYSKCTSGALLNFKDANT
ncbi:MAG: YigZ family protein [Clostridia bacterium]|nr:YigZ family protein [Clostridia bacterium]